MRAKYLAAFWFSACLACTPLRALHDCNAPYRYLVVRESSLETAVVENLRLAPSFRDLPGFAARWSIGLEQAKALHEMAQPDTEPESYRIQRQVVNQVMDWIEANPTGDLDTAFGTRRGKIGLTLEQFHTAFLGSPLAARSALQQEALRRKVAYSPFDYRWKEGIPDSQRGFAQQMAARQILEWIKANPGKPLERSNFGHGPGKVGLTQDQLYATGYYRLDAPEDTSRYASRYFDSMAHALMTVKNLAHTEGVAFNLIDFNWRGGIPAEILPVIQQEAAQRAVDWLKNHPGKQLGKSAYGTAEGEVGITQDQMNGTGEYRAGKTKHGSRYFDSMEIALLKIKRLAVQQGVPFRLMDYSFEGGIDEKIRPEIQKEAVTAVVDWLEKNPGEKMVDSNFGPQGSDKITVKPAQLFGQGDYGPGGIYETSHYFQSREAGVLAIKAAALERGVTFRVIDLNWRGGFPTSLRPTVEKEVLDTIVDWARRNNGKKIVRTTFGDGPNQINLDEARVFGTTRYSVGGTSRESRYFDDRASGTAAIVKALKEAGLLTPINWVEEESTPANRGEPPL